jgi:hypothetical protein
MRISELHVARFGYTHDVVSPGLDVISHLLAVAALIGSVLIQTYGVARCPGVAPDINWFHVNVVIRTAIDAAANKRMKHRSGAVALADLMRSRIAHPATVSARAPSCVQNAKHNVALIAPRA